MRLWHTPLASALPVPDDQAAAHGCGASRCSSHEDASTGCSCGTGDVAASGCWSRPPSLPAGGGPAVTPASRAASAGAASAGFAAAAGCASPGLELRGGVAATALAHLFLGGRRSRLRGLHREPCVVERRDQLGPVLHLLREQLTGRRRGRPPGHRRVLFR
jgi:hypothetical protein